MLLHMQLPLPPAPTMKQEHTTLQRPQELVHLQKTTDAGPAPTQQVDHAEQTNNSNSTNMVTVSNEAYATSIVTENNAAYTKSKGCEYLELICSGEL